MADRFPGYDVLAKRHTQSWNPQTRAAVDARLALAERTDVLTPAQLATLRLIAERVCPQPEGRPPANTVALVLDKIARDAGDGYRKAGMPRTAEAWRRGLDAIDAESRARYGAAFAALPGERADTVLRAVEAGEVQAPDWQDFHAKAFWAHRLIHDVVSAHWAHPSLWSAMGFGGPASPRGYVRLEANRRDAWEAVEADSADPGAAETRNQHVG